MAAAANEVDVVLVETPFADIDRPSLGLSLLKAEVQRAGFSCRVVYLSLQFAARIGVDPYRLIGSCVSQSLLLGDRVFSSPRSRFGLTTAPDLSEEVPPLLRELFPNLQAAAAEFVACSAEEIVRLNPTLVGFSTLFQTIPTLALAAHIKASRPGILTIAGGSNCEGEMGLAMFRQYSQLDFVCRGPGEVLLPTLIAQLKAAGDPNLAAIDGLLWRDQAGAVQINRDVAIEEPLDSQPIPEFSDWLAQLATALPSVDRDNLWLPLESSRGCWWGQKSHCVFCGLNGSTMHFREKSSSRLLAELESFRRYGIRNIYATDLIFPYRYFETFLPELAAHALRGHYHFFYEIKSNLRKTQLRQLRDAGITWLQPGIEALDTEILRIMNKGASALQQVQLLKWAVELGVSLSWNFLLGLGSAAAYQRSAQLVHLLRHLVPPNAGCCPIRVDRFSPMYDEWPRFSTTPPQPSPAYEKIHPGAGAAVARIAYHFEYSGRDLSDSAPLRGAVRAWEAVAGRVSLLHWTDETGAVHVFDSRSDPAQRFTLSGTAADLYLQLDAGQSKNQLLAGNSAPAADVECELRRFLDHQWVVELDGKYLALSCDYSSEAAPLPPAIRAPALHVLHTERVARMWRQGRERRELVGQFSTPDHHARSHESVFVS